MTCELSYPSQILKKGSPLFDTIIDEDGLLDLKDPTKNIPPEKLIDATNALNNAFNGIRNATGPVNYGQQAFANDFPTLAEKLDTLGPMTKVETALFINDYGQDPDNIVAVMNNHTPGVVPTQAFNDVCSQCDNFLNTNMGAALSAGLCGAFPDVFGKIAAAIALVESVQGLIDDIKNFDPEDFINGLVAQIIGPLKAIAEAIKKTIESIAKSLEKAAKDIAKQAEDFAKDMKEAGTKIINKIKAAVQKVLDFLAKPNMDKLKEGIDGIISASSSAFEKMDTVILGLLMFRFCQLAGGVQDFLKKPMDSLVKLVVAMKAAGAIMDNISKKENKKAVEAGAVRIDPTEVPNIKDDARQRVNNAAPKTKEIVNTAREIEGNLTDSEITVEELPPIGVTDEEFLTNQELIDLVEQAIGEVEKIEGADVKPIEEDIKSNTGAEVEPEVAEPRPPLLISAFDGVEIRPYVHIMAPNDQQAGWLTQLATDKELTSGIQGQFTFDSAMAKITVRKDGTDTEEPGPAWTEVHPDTWIRLFEMKEQVESIQLKVKDAFNPNKPTLKDGTAVHLDIAGYPEDDIIELIIAASRAGWKFIYVRSSIMVLADFGRSGTGTGGQLVQDALKIHTADEWIHWRPAVKVQ